MRAATTGNFGARHRAASCVVAIVLGVGAFAVGARADAAMPTELGPWLFWNSPTAQQSFSALSQRVTPRNLAPTIYWSTQWFWNGAANGGYAGIQTDGIRADGSIGPMAIFSVWDATRAIPGPNAACIPFSGEGVGRSCRMPIAVTAGHTYRTDVAAVRVDAAGQWWHATIVDETSGAVADLGEIPAPANATAYMPATFVEYFGRPVGCGQEPIVLSDFEAPRVRPAGTGTSLPSSYQQATTRTCARALVAATPTGATMTFGGPQPSFVPNARVVTPLEPAGVWVAWDTAISDGGSPISGYTVQSSTNGGTSWQLFASTNGNSRNATATNMAPGTYTFRVAAVNSAGTGAWSDPTPPLTVTAATPSLTSPTTPVQLATSFPVSWTGDLARIDHFDVQRRTATWNGRFGAWSDWLTNTTATTAQFAGTTGRTTCFRVRSTDKAGAVSAYSAARCTTVPLRSDQVSYSAGWSKLTNPDVYAGFAYRTTATGASMTRRSILGERLYLVATRCASCGTVDVRFKGVRVATVNLEAPTTQRKQVIPVGSFSSVQGGTLTLTVTSAAGKTVTLEGLAVFQD